MSSKPTRKPRKPVATKPESPRPTIPFEIAADLRWEVAGRKLVRFDPQRFLKLLEIAERLVAVEEDPMSVRLESPSDGGRITYDGVLASAKRGAA
jgi:hypothetical protein